MARVVDSTARRQARMSEARFQKIIALIQATFQDREFNTEEYRELFGFSRQSAQKDLLYICSCGALTRRRVPAGSNGGWFWLYALGNEQKRGVVRWRKKESAALDDDQLIRIAKGVVKRVLSKSMFNYGFEYDDLLSVALETAFTDHKEFYREGVNVARAWQATVLWNKCYFDVVEWIKQQVGARKFCNRVDVKFLGNRDKVFESMEREESVRSLYEAVVDAGIEAAPQYVFSAFFENLIDARQSTNDKYKRVRLAAIIGRELFGDVSDQDAREIGLPDRDVQALNGSLPHNSRNSLYSARDIARRHVYGALIEQCLNGDRAIPHRELKNLRLLKQLEEAGF